VRAVEDVYALALNAILGGSPAMRTCTDCDQTRPLEEFLPIRGTPYVYGRCRVCRNARARARYHSTPETRAAEVARAWKNKQARKLRRRLQVVGAVDS
jgi:hypothetical protein